VSYIVEWLKTPSLINSGTRRLLILSVEPRVGGIVSLSDGSSFLNRTEFVKASSAQLGNPLVSSRKDAFKAAAQSLHDEVCSENVLMARRLTASSAKNQEKMLIQEVEARISVVKTNRSGMSFMAGKAVMGFAKGMLNKKGKRVGRHLASHLENTDTPYFVINRQLSGCPLVLASDAMCSVFGRTQEMIRGYTFEALCSGGGGGSRNQKKTRLATDRDVMAAVKASLVSGQSIDEVVAIANAEGIIKIFFLHTEPIPSTLSNAPVPEVPDLMAGILQDVTNIFDTDHDGEISTQEVRAAKEHKIANPQWVASMSQTLHVLAQSTGVVASGEEERERREAKRYEEEMQNVKEELNMAAHSAFDKAEDGVFSELHRGGIVSAHLKSYAANANPSRDEEHGWHADGQAMVNPNDVDMREEYWLRFHTVVVAGVDTDPSVKKATTAAKEMVAVGSAATFECLLFDSKAEFHAWWLGPDGRNNFPEVKAGTVQTRSSFGQPICWTLEDLGYSELGLAAAGRVSDRKFVGSPEELEKLLRREEARINHVGTKGSATPTGWLDPDWTEFRSGKNRYL
jgi:hypothetical protein